MSIEQTAIELRPLEPNRCTELGFALARQWYWSLVSLYLVAFAPLLLAAGFAAYLFPDYFWAIQAVLWWFKPLGELTLLLWCSQALFTKRAEMKPQVLSAYKSLPRLLLNYLGLSRLSPTRGFSMCVVFLEKTAVGKGRKRLDVLSGSGGALSWVLVVGIHLEFILAIGASVMLLYLIPTQSPLTEEFNNLDVIVFTEYLDSSLYIFCAVAAQILFAPFFVCASFVHYINRRSRLEGWDIQHAFRELNSRVAREKQTLNKKRSTFVSACAMLVFMGLSAQPQPVQASDADEAQTAVQQVLKQERFGHYSERGRLKLKDQDEDKVEPSKSSFEFLEYIFDIVKSDLFSRVVVLLAGLLLAYFVFKVLIRYWPFLAGLFANLSLARSAAKKPSDKVTVHVPAASFDEARQLMLVGDTREALACLLRAVISAAKQQSHVQILPSSTETECAIVIAQSLDEKRQTAFNTLLQVWRKQAYAGQSVASIYADKVLLDCEDAFVEKKT